MHYVLHRHMKPRGASWSHAVVVLFLGIIVIAGVLVTGCKSAAQKSSELLEFTPSLASSYDEAYKIACERASDAKLVMIRTVEPVEEGYPSTWSYIFYSKIRVSAYLVSPKDGELSVDDYPSYSMTSDEWDSIIDISAITEDADAAYSQAVAQLDGNQAVDNCTSYLSLLSKTEEGVVPGSWYFVFNYDEERSSNDTAIVTSVNALSSQS